MARWNPYSRDPFDDDSDESWWGGFGTAQWRLMQAQIAQANEARTTMDERRAAAVIAQAKYESQGLFGAIDSAQTARLAQQGGFVDGTLFTPNADEVGYANWTAGDVARGASSVGRRYLDWQASQIMATPFVGRAWQAGGWTFDYATAGLGFMDNLIWTGQEYDPVNGNLFGTGASSLGELATVSSYADRERAIAMAEFPSIEEWFGDPLPTMGYGTPTNSPHYDEWAHYSTIGGQLSYPAWLISSGYPIDDSMAGYYENQEWRAEKIMAMQSRYEGVLQAKGEDVFRQTYESELAALDEAYNPYQYGFSSQQQFRDFEMAPVLMWGENSWFASRGFDPADTESDRWNSPSSMIRAYGNFIANHEFVSQQLVEQANIMRMQALAGGFVATANAQEVLRQADDMVREAEKMMTMTPADYIAEHSNLSNQIVGSFLLDWSSAAGLVMRTVAGTPITRRIGSVAKRFGIGALDDAAAVDEVLHGFGVGDEIASSATSQSFVTRLFEDKMGTTVYGPMPADVFHQKPGYLTPQGWAGIAGAGDRRLVEAAYASAGAAADTQRAVGALSPEKVLPNVYDWVPFGTLSRPGHAARLQDDAGNLFNVLLGQVELDPARGFSRKFGHLGYERLMDTWLDNPSEFLGGLPWERLWDMGNRIHGAQNIPEWMSMTNLPSTMQSAIRTSADSTWSDIANKPLNSFEEALVRGWQAVLQGSGADEVTNILWPALDDAARSGLVSNVEIGGIYDEIVALGDNAGLGQWQDAMGRLYGALDPYREGMAAIEASASQQRIALANQSRAAAGLPPIQVGRGASSYSSWASGGSYASLMDATTLSGSNRLGLSYGALHLDPNMVSGPMAQQIAAAINSGGRGVVGSALERMARVEQEGFGAMRGALGQNWDDNPLYYGSYYQRSIDQGFAHTPLARGLGGVMEEAMRAGDQFAPNPVKAFERGLGWVGGQIGNAGKAAGRASASTAGLERLGWGAVDRTLGVAAGLTDIVAKTPGTLLTSAVIMSQLALNVGWGMRNIFNAVGTSWMDGTLWNMGGDEVIRRFRNLGGFGFEWQVDDLSAAVGKDLMGQGTFVQRVMDMGRGVGNAARYGTAEGALKTAERGPQWGIPGMLQGLETRMMDLFYGEQSIFGVALGERGHRLRTSLATSHKALDKWVTPTANEFVRGVENLNLQTTPETTRSLNRMLNTLADDMRRSGGSEAMAFYSDARGQIAAMVKNGELSPQDGQRLMRHLQEETLPKMMNLSAGVAEAGAQGSRLTMLDPRYTQNYQEWMSGIFMYSFFRTQSAVNWVERLANAPDFLARFARVNRVVQQENQESGVPAVLEDTIPAPFWQDARIPNPWNLIFPMGVITARDWRETEEDPSLESGLFSAFNAASLTPNPILRMLWDMSRGETPQESIFGQMPHMRFFTDSATFDYQVGLQLASWVENGRITQEQAYMAFDVRMSQLRGVETDTIAPDALTTGTQLWTEAENLVRSNTQWASGTSMTTGVRVSTLDSTGAQLRADADKYFQLEEKSQERKNWLQLHPGIPVRWLAGAFYPGADDLDDKHENLRREIRPQQRYETTPWMQGEFGEWIAQDPLDQSVGSLDARAILAWVQSGFQEERNKRVVDVAEETTASRQSAELTTGGGSSRYVPLPFVNYLARSTGMDLRDVDGDLINEDSEDPYYERLPRDEVPFFGAAQSGQHNVYLLIDPITGQARYVGKTNNPERRLAQHLQQPFEEPHHPKSQWELELYSKGQFPYMRVIESGISSADIDTREEIWIGYLKYISGNDSVNVDIPTREEWDLLLEQQGLSYSDLAEMAGDFAGMNTVLPSTVYNKIGFTPQNVAANTYGYVDPYDLTQVKHIGEKAQTALQADPDPRNRVVTLYQLARMNSLQIAKITGLSDARAEEARLDAQRLIKETSDEPYYALLNYMELDDLAGVGAETVKKLNNAGVLDIAGLAGASVDELMAQGLTEAKVLDIIGQAQVIVFRDSAYENRVASEAAGWQFVGVPMFLQNSSTAIGFSSGLREIVGVGAEMERDLIGAGIESIDDLAAASLETLDAIPGIGLTTAEKIRSQARQMTTYSSMAPMTRAESQQASPWSWIAGWRDFGAASAASGAIPATMGLEALNGIGDVGTKRHGELVDAGYHTLEDVALASAQDIVEKTSIGQVTAEKIITEAQVLTGIVGLDEVVPSGMLVDPIESVAVPPALTTSSSPVRRNPFGPQLDPGALGGWRRELQTEQDYWWEFEDWWNLRGGSRGGLTDVGDSREELLAQVPTVLRDFAATDAQAAMWLAHLTGDKWTSRYNKDFIDAVIAAGDDGEGRMTVAELAAMSPAAIAMGSGYTNEEIALGFSGIAREWAGTGSVPTFGGRKWSEWQAGQPFLQMPVEGSVPVFQEFGGQTQEYAKLGYEGGHPSVDFYTGWGAPIFSAGEGVVELIVAPEEVELDHGDFVRTGTYGIRVRHPDGSSTTYSHLQDIFVEQGQGVTASTQLGTIGAGFESSGGFGGHLDFMYVPADADLDNGYQGAVDPMGFLYERGGSFGASGPPQAPAKVLQRGVVGGVTGGVANTPKPKAPSSAPVAVRGASVASALGVVLGRSPVNATRPETEKESFDSFDLTVLPGVGEAKAEVLRAGGFASVLDVANASPAQIAALKGFGDVTSAQVIIGARSLMGDDSLYLPFVGDLDSAQQFGANPQNYSRFGLDGHEGVDYMMAEGTTLYSAGEGTVKTVGWDPSGYGTYVVVRHTDGSETLYAHLSEAKVEEGASVTATTSIGKSGNTGNSSGPHLHLGYRPPNADQGNGFKGFIDPSDMFAERGSELPDIGTDYSGLFAGGAMPPSAGAQPRVGVVAGVGRPSAGQAAQQPSQRPVSGVAASFLLQGQQVKKDKAKVDAAEEEEDDGPIVLWSDDGLVSYNELGQRLDSLGHVAWRDDGTVDVNEKLKAQGRYLMKRREAAADAQDVVNIINDPRLTLPMAAPLPELKASGQVSPLGAQWTVMPMRIPQVQGSPSQTEAAATAAAAATRQAEILRIREMERVALEEMERIRQEQERLALQSVTRAWRKALS